MAAQIESSRHHGSLPAPPQAHMKFLVDRHCSRTPRHDGVKARPRSGPAQPTVLVSTVYTVILGKSVC